MEYINQIDLNNELTPNEQCVRCKVTAANFICDECNCNTLYCSNCDGYIHSLPSKRHHQRRFIQESFNNNSYRSQLESTNNNIKRHNSSRYGYQLPETDNQSLNNNNHQMTISQNYINEIKEIYEKEKEGLVSKINIINKQLTKTTSTLNERIEYLHSHIETMKHEHKREIERIVSDYHTQTDQLSNEHNNQIAFYNEKLNRMEEVISNQLEKIKENEIKLYDNEGTFKAELNKTTFHLDEIIHENNSMKQFYEKRIEDLTKLTGEDKNKLVASYEESIHQLKEGYQISKEKYLEVIQQREDDMKGMMQHYQKEIKELNSIIDRLKLNYDSVKKDQDELIVMNEKLKHGLEGANEVIENNKNQIDLYTKEKRDLKEQLEDIQQEYDEVSEKIAKVNRITYGKFTKPKTNKTQKKTK